MTKTQKYEVLIFGDSIVFGLNDPFGGWVTRFKEYYHQKEFLEKSEFKRIHNLGISGNTSKDLFERVENEFKCRYHINRKNVVIIAVGGNDIGKNCNSGEFVVNVEEFSSNILNIVKIINESSSNNTDIIICSILPVNEEITLIPSKKGGVIRSLADVFAYNEVLRRLCKSFDIRFIDLYKEYDPKTDLDKIDGLHPNLTGHEKILTFMIKLFKYNY